MMAAMVFKEEAKNEDADDKLVDSLDSSYVDGNKEKEGDSEKSGSREGVSESLGSNNASDDKYHVLDLHLDISEFDRSWARAK